MFIKTANAKIVEKIGDPNLIVATKRFPNFAKRTAAVQPIRLYPDKFLYLRNRSISAMETHGPNQNGDAFPRRELMNRHSTFIGTPVTVDHTEERVIGMVLDSVWVPKMLFKATSKQLVAYDQNNIEPGDQIVGDWVENILALDRTQANAEHPNLTEQIEDGEITDTSMGTFVQYSICSVPGCRTRAANPEEYCKHIAKFKNKIYSGSDTQDQRTHVYEENYDLSFFEDSVIIPEVLGGYAGGEGADTSAKVLEKIAAVNKELDLGPYIIRRTADAQVIDLGETPAAVEEGEEQYQQMKEDEVADMQKDQLKQEVEERITDIERKVEDLKGLVMEPTPEKTETDEMSQSSKKQADLDIPEDIKQRINSGELRQTYGLDTESGSTYYNLRQKGYSDLEAQFLIFKDRVLGGKKQAPGSGVVDESIWEDAKAQANKQNKGNNYAYISSIYQSMGGTYEKKKSSIAAIVEIRSNNYPDFSHIISAFRNIDHKIIGLKGQGDQDSYYAKVEIDDSDTYKVSALSAEADKLGKDVTLHTIKTSRRTSMFTKGQFVTFSAKVSEVDNGHATIATPDMKLAVNKNLLASVKDPDAKILLASKAKLALSTLRIKAAENIEEGDEVFVPGIISEAPEGEDVLMKLDVDAETEYEEEFIPVDELFIPPAQIEAEELEVIPEETQSSKRKASAEDTSIEVAEIISDYSQRGVEWEDEANELIDEYIQEGGSKEELQQEFNELFEGTAGWLHEEVEWIKNKLQSSKNKLQFSKKKAMPEPKPKNKVPGAGGNSGSPKKERDFSTMQKRKTPAPKDKVPDAGSNGPNAFKHASKDELVNLDDKNIQAAIDASKKKEAVVVGDSIQVTNPDGSQAQGKVEVVNPDGTYQVKTDNGMITSSKEATIKKKAADLPEFASEEMPGELPKKTDALPEIAEEGAILNDQSKKPEGNVTQLSNLRKANLGLLRKVAAKDKEIGRLKASHTESTKTIAALEDKLRPLAVEAVLRDLVTSNQLQRSAIPAQRKELTAMYRNSSSEFTAMQKLANMAIANKNVTASTRSVREASKNNLSKNAELELTDDPSTPVTQNTTPTLDDGNLFDE